MKKNRPGTRISVLGELYTKDVLVATMIRESTTIGVRVTYPERFETAREIVEVQTPLGPAKAKLATYEGETVNISPEYESCRQLSAQSGVPLKQVYAIVLEAARASAQAQEEAQ